MLGQKSLRYTTFMHEDPIKSVACMHTKFECVKATNPGLTQCHAYSVDLDSPSRIQICTNLKRELWAEDSNSFVGITFHARDANATQLKRSRATNGDANIGLDDSRTQLPAETEAC